MDPLSKARPSYEDVLAASKRLYNIAVKTPLIENNYLNELVGGRVFLKAETLQHTGSFKFRGAYNFLAQLNESHKKNGVVAYSSGNHAQGVAAAAKLLKIKSTIIMPSDAPSIKLNQTRILGAEVITFEREKENREEIASNFSKKTGSTIIPPYDHPWTISGQGTVGAEIIDKLDRIGLYANRILICCGGGGLTAGIATVVSEKSPASEIIVVDPVGYDDTTRSLKERKILKNKIKTKSICDALLAQSPGNLTFSINKELVSGGIAVTDEDVIKAMSFSWKYLKLVVEPSGAVALAAILKHKKHFSKLTSVVILSGANVDPVFYSKVIK